MATVTRHTRQWAGLSVLGLFVVSCGDAPASGAVPADSSDASADPAADAGALGPPPSTADGAAPFPATDGGVPPRADRGATLPFWEYEAEDMRTNGVVIGPSRTFGDIAAESSGRRAVRLDATGQGLEIQTMHRANSIVIRYVIPDAPGGFGTDATIGLYVDGVRTKSLALTSRYAWVYGGEASSSNNTPGGGAHHFYDEVRLLTDEIPVGATVRLQRDAQDTAAYYVIDLMDLEEVSAPLAAPAGSLSITDFGATPNDATDDAAAITRTLAAARTEGKSVWIPQGTFECIAAPLVVSGVTIRGAGMWHSTLHGHNAQFKVSGDNNRFYDFAIVGDVDTRDDQKGDNGFDGPAGAGSHLENVWIEHMKVGWWVGKGAFVGIPTRPLTDGLVVRGVRIRNTFADGINLCNGTSNSVVEQSHFRNTGDDSLAAWSPSFDGTPDVGNVFRFNTVQSPWRATCFAIYGGKDNRIEDNVCADTVEYPGVLIASTAGFRTHPFDGTTSVLRDTLVRSGGPMYGQGHGALKLFADGTPIAGVLVKDIRLADSTFAGIHLGGPNHMSGIVFDAVTIEKAGTFAIQVDSNAQGTAQASGVIATGAASGGLANAAPTAWTFVKGAGNSGW